MDTRNPDRDAITAVPNTNWIIQMKGVAMVLIILFHWFGHFLSGVLKLVANAGAQGNHIFFILSAFGLYLSISRRKSNISIEFDWGKWLIKRAKKILIPYYISIAVIFISIAAYGYITNSWTETLQRMHLNVNTALSTIFLYRNFVASYAQAINTPWWFAITILQFYFLFPFLCFFISKLGSRWFCIFTFLINALYVFIYAVLLKSDSIVYEYLPFKYIFSFSLGFILCRDYIRDEILFSKRLASKKLLAVGLVLEAIGIYLAFQGEAGKSFNDLFFGPGIFLLTFSFVNLLSKFRAAIKFFHLVGEYSLPLFLLHTPFIYLFYSGRMTGCFLNNFLYFITYISFLIFLTWGTSKLFISKSIIDRGPDAITSR